MDVLIQYRIQKEKVDEQIAAVQSFVQSIQEMEDIEIEYAAYQLPDGVSFKHVVHLASEEDKARLQAQPFFEKFAGEIDARCDEEPTVTPLTLVAGTRA